MRFNLFVFSAIILLLSSSIHAQSYKIIESNNQKIVVQFNFAFTNMMRDTVVNGERFTYFPNTTVRYGKPGDPWIPDYFVNIGIPYNSIAEVRVLNIKKSTITNKLVLPLPDSLKEPFYKMKFNQRIYGSGRLYPQNAASNADEFIYRYARVLQLHVAPVQYNPLSREIIYNNNIRVEVNFRNNSKSNLVVSRIPDKFTEDFLKSGVINGKTALSFMGKIENLNKSPLDTSVYWYNPQKNYYKIYLNKKGLYRVTYNWLVQNGVPGNDSLQAGHLEIINNGVELPLDIEDVNGDGKFNAGDYFQFVGDRAQPTTQYTYLNIYNNTNVYWFSYQADTVYKYTSIDGYPSIYYPQIKSTLSTIHYESDHIFQPFGEAPITVNRDYWMWSAIRMVNGHPYPFSYYIPDSLGYYIDPDNRYVTLRTYLQGMSNPRCSYGHVVRLRLNGYAVDTLRWNYQNFIIDQRTFPVSINSNPDSVQLFDSQNQFTAEDMLNCDTTNADLSWMNWFEVSYWRLNKINSNKFIFTSPPNVLGEKTVHLWKWYSDNMKIFIPSKGEVITNPYITLDTNKNVYFNYTFQQSDTSSPRTEFYCYANNVFLTPDSLKPDVSSDLRNINNGADYIIITNSKFMSEAQRLANFRSSNLSGFSNPRVKIVDVNNIYDEFSYGLLNPYALQYFVKYAFQNWQTPAPSFVVLFGDMSHDYRHILSDSKPNFVSSIPYQVGVYGQAQSDNLIVAVSGNDIVPDLAVGRISCETTQQADLLIDKIVNYPADQGKEWKQNVMLLASGIDAEDAKKLGFNSESNRLANTYLEPNGYHITKVYHYPDNHLDSLYIGGTQEMRQTINNGGAFLNYYGHGGGGQWDLVFTDDDINELQNGNKLPVVSSVTCYTAHFDDQDCFGELFNRAENKGSVAFIGSSALTWWKTGAWLDTTLFRQVFSKKNYVIGKAILDAKIKFGPDPMVAITTLLGDPGLRIALPDKPDFSVSPADISFSLSNPLLGDTVMVKAKIHNLGIVFPDTSIYVQIYQNVIDTSHLIKEFRLYNFGELDSVITPWIPNQAGLYNIIVQVNIKDPIDEMDPSDNSATAEIAVYDFGEPNIIAPLNGLFTNQNTTNFKFWDIGPYFNRDMKYIIKIDTSVNFSSSFKITSPVLTPQDGILRWQSPPLANNNYFWKATIFDNADTNTSTLKTFSITNEQGSGYLATKKQLKLFNLNNTLYSDSLNSLILNTDVIPPHPFDDQVLDSIIIPLTSDSTWSTTFSTDGTYLYYGNEVLYTGGEPSKIYKVGTGYNGSVKGFNYGAIPNLSIKLKNQIFCYSDGYIYLPDSTGQQIIKINPADGTDTTHIQLPVPLLPCEYGVLRNGKYYLTSDGRYVYNLTNGYDTLMGKFTLRVYDPQNGWQQVGTDKTMNGSSFYGFSSFFIVDGYLYTYETYSSGYMKGYRISDGTYLGEWSPYSKAKLFSIWSYDWANNFVWALKFMPFFAKQPGFYKFLGTYQQASGSITTEEIGPAFHWNDISYNMDATGSLGHYTADLLGKNRYTNTWDTLKTDLPLSYSLANLNANKYGYLKIYFSMIDSALGSDEPMKLKSVKADFSYPPEIGMFPSDITLSNDTLLQGFSDQMKLKVHNYGYNPDDSVLVNFYFNDSSYTFFTKRLSLAVDSTIEIDRSISTDSLVYTSGISKNEIKVVASTPYQELFSFNNIIKKDLYVTRDSTRPKFDITFDGKQIINGDVVRANPVVVMTLKDNSPLPLDTSFFSVVFDNKPLYFSTSDVQYTYTPYPNSKSTIRWTPKLSDTTHTLAVLAKDASGNFFDSTAYQISFVVESKPSLKNVYNYPNPFKTDTYFTCEFGSLTPDEFYIKIYTIAGRLIRDIKVPTSGLVPGFNKIYWNGRDEDGDALANGVYIYKMVAKIAGETKSVIQKLAKVQ